MNNLFQFSQPLDNNAKTLFNDEHQEFLAELVDTFQPRLNELLEKRQQRQAYYDDGALPDFDPNTQDIREGNWKIAELPKDLKKRRLEITGPVDRKMVINALNANVDCYMAAFEDSLSPTWDGMVIVQFYLRDANIGGMTYTDLTAANITKSARTRRCLLLEFVVCTCLKNMYSAMGRPFPAL